MNHQQLRELVRQHFSKKLDTAKAQIDADGPVSDKMRADVLESIKSASLQLEHGFPLPVFAEVSANTFLDEHGIFTGRENIDLEKLARLILQGRRAYFEEALNHSAKAETFEFGSPVQPPGADTKNDDPSLTLEQLVGEFWKFSKLGKLWTSKTEGEKLDHIQLLYERLGKTVSVSAFGRKQAHLMRETLLSYPSNRNKSRLTRGKPLLEVLGMPQVPKLHPLTINKYIQTYSGMFNWAVRNGHCASNPFEGLSVPTKKVRRDAPRRPFTDGQLTKIRDAVLAKAGPKEQHHKWGTLIAIHTGARLNEVAQLHLEDITLVEGIWCFDINMKEGTNKRLKNATSIRVVPVHPRLLEYGFMAYVQEMTALRGNELLFPQLTYSRSDGYGRNLGRWVNERLLPDLGIKTDALTFHSFRHTMVRKLIAAEVTQPHIMAIVGHEQGTTTLDTYNRNGFPPVQLLAALEKSM